MMFPAPDSPGVVLEVARSSSGAGSVVRPLVGLPAGGAAPSRVLRAAPAPWARGAGPTALERDCAGLGPAWVYILDERSVTVTGTEGGFRVRVPLDSAGEPMAGAGLIMAAECGARLERCQHPLSHHWPLPPIAPDVFPGALPEPADAYRTTLAALTGTAVLAVLRPDGTATATTLASHARPSLLLPTLGALARAHGWHALPTALTAHDWWTLDPDTPAPDTPDDPWGRIGGWGHADHDQATSPSITTPIDDALPTTATITHHGPPGDSWLTLWAPDPAHDGQWALAIAHHQGTGPTPLTWLPQDRITGPLAALTGGRLERGLPLP